jgi:excisionase family DNA binding protein
MTGALDRFDPVTPTEEESRLAEDSSRRLAPLLRSGEDLRMRIVGDGGAGEQLTLPGSVVRILSQVLAEMGLGNAVAVTPVRAELSTQQAADLLNVSRPYLIALLDKGEIPFRKVGKHRRVPVRDLLDYKKRSQAEQFKALDALTEQAQELDMGY